MTNWYNFVYIYIYNVTVQVIYIKIQQNQYKNIIALSIYVKALKKDE